MNKKSFLAIITLLVLAGMCTAAFAQYAYRLTMDGRRLSAEEAESIEKRLEQNPQDTQLRTKLIGYYSSNQFKDPSARKARQKHILWLIKNSPEAEILGIPDGILNAGLDGDAYIQGKENWLENIKQKPDDLKVLEHSANYFLQNDRELAEKSLQKARSLDMNNPKWPEKLGQLYRLGMITNSLKAEADAAAKAFEQFETAYELSTDMARDPLLKYLAKTALAAGKPEKAGEYAEKMLIGTSTNWNYGNNIHHGNIILGLIALKQGDIEEARKRLIKAGNTPGSPQLNSFGPNMELAKELLEKGEKSVVLEYFDLCSKFWNDRRNNLEEWTAAVKDGKIPNFGANLVY